MAVLRYNGVSLSANPGTEIPATTVTLDVEDAAAITSYACRVLVNGADTTVTGTAAPAPFVRDAATGLYRSRVTLDLSAVPLGPITIRESYRVGTKSYTYTGKLSTVVAHERVSPDPEARLFSRGLPASRVTLPARYGVKLPNGADMSDDTAQTFIVVKALSADEGSTRTVVLDGTSVRGTAELETLPNGKRYAFVSLDLSSVLPGTYTLRETSTDSDGVPRVSTLPVTVASMAPWDQIEHRSGNRIPRADLVVITGAVAASMADISAHLIYDSITPKVRQSGSHDFTVNANRNLWGALTGDNALLNGYGGVSSDYDFVTLDGMESTPAGEPVVIHQVQAGAWQGHTVRHALVMRVNDGFRLGSGGKFLSSTVHSHVKVFGFGKSTEEQHRDGGQMQMGSGQRVEGCYFDNETDRVHPTLSDGSPVPGAVYARGAQGFQINADNDITGIVTFKGTYVRGGNGGQLTVTDRINPQTGAQWHYLKYDAAGVLTSGLVVENYIVTMRSVNNLGTPIASVIASTTTRNRIKAEPTNKLFDPATRTFTTLPS